MKNLKIVVLGIALIGNTMAFSQKEAKMTVEEKSDKITARLTEELDLSTSQSSEIKALNIDFISNERRVRSDESLSKEQKKELISTSNKSKKAKMESILSKEQLEKMSEMRKDKKGKKKNKKNASPAEKAQKMTSKLDAQVSLTPSQRESVNKVNLHTVIESNKIKQDTSLSDEDRKNAKKKIHKHKKEQLKSILTKEQLAKLKEGKKAKK